MELPNELYVQICNGIEKITDLRKFTQTSKYFNGICNKRIPIVVEIYKQKYYVGNFLLYESNYGYALRRYSIEIVVDGYYHFLNNDFYDGNNCVFMFMLFAYVGNMELLKLTYHNFKINVYDIDETIQYASQNCNIDILEYLYNKHVEYYGNNARTQFGFSWIIYIAYSNDNPKLLEWMVSKGKKIDMTEFCGVVKFGKFNLVKWFNDNDHWMSFCYSERNLCRCIKTLQLLVDSEYIEDYSELYDNAIKNGYDEVAEWILTNVDKSKLNI